MEDRRPGAKETQAPLPAEAPQLRELKPNIYQFRSEKPGSHVYLVKGDTKNILIDTGVATKFPILEAHLAELKLSSRDIHLVLLTHEHFDHIGATAFFSWQSSGGSTSAGRKQSRAAG